ncbi:MAG: glycosyltransferase family 2 protein [Candidatus Omnitrophota bacterium]|nr:glycosyltransferase family 2 protein [Candidatus Omnitrophota bacterium]
MANKMPLSVVVLTKNEANNIEECLSSVYGFADEIIVIDDESADKTRDIANKFADKILIRRMDNEGRHRNWAYAQAKNDWVLSLDADEKVTEELKAEIAANLKDTNFTGFSIPLRNYIGDYWVQHSGWYPAGKLRLFRKSKFKYEEVEVHPRVFLDGECGHLTKDIIHKGYPDFEHFLASLNRQTTLEAVKWINTNRKMSLGKASWRTIDRFFRSFFGKKGYKDGFIGFMIAIFASFYQIISYAKYREMKKTKVINK